SIRAVHPLCCANEPGTEKWLKFNVLEIARQDSGIKDCKRHAVQLRYLTKRLFICLGVAPHKKQVCKMNMRSKRSKESATMTITFVPSYFNLLTYTSH
ncbi:hypothetical protein L9F63_027231, partial [Diploptera punctata]